MTARSNTGQQLPVHIGSDPGDADLDTAGIIGILDAVDVPIVVVSRECTVSRFNQAATEMLDLVPTDIGRSLSDIGALAGFEEVEALCAQVMTDEIPCRRDIRSGDRVFLLRVAPLGNHEKRMTGAVLTFTNVTAFRASLEQAIYEREYTKSILNTVANPLVVLDASLSVQSGNRAFHTMFDVSREKAHGVPLWSLGGDDWKASGLWAALSTVLSDREEFSPIEIQCDFPQLGRRTVSIDARPVSREDSGTILLAVQDITEHRLSVLQLQEADRRKDEFLALLAHELRNPLAPIRTGLELIRLSGDAPQSIRRVRPIMERQVAQMVRLIDDLMDVSRIASDKIVLQKSTLSLAELVASAVEAQRVAIDDAKLKLEVDLPPVDCTVNVDPTRFVQILANVLHNAAKFTPAQGQIRCAVEARSNDGAPEVSVTISDTGIGISEEMLPRLFEMFSQGESATECAHGGLGIGLALARRLAQMHGGDIVAHSAGAGKGSTFAITIPVSEMRAVLPPSRPVDLPRLTSRVVIIDDNRDAASTTSMLVEELGGSARLAHDAVTGLEAVRQFQPDVVLLDIGMPGIDGYETCRRMREQTSRQPVFIVAVTGWGQSDDKQRAIDAGFDAHLTKPVEPAALIRLLAGSATGRGIEGDST